MSRRKAKRRNKPRKRKPVPVPIMDARIIADRTMDEIRRRCAKEGKPVTCPTGPEAVGCNGCCRGAVIVLPVELSTIMRKMDAAAWKRIDDQGDEILEKPRQAVCPLLDPETGGCTVYDVRPIACRLYAVVSPPSDCDADAVPGAEVSIPSPCPANVDWIAMQVLGTEDETTLLTHTVLLAPSLVNERRRRLRAKAAKRAKRGKAPK